jgi:PAS domain S-box-containing protein
MLLLLAQAFFATLLSGAVDFSLFAWILFDAAFTCAEVCVGWWLFYSKTRSHRRFSDPLSAMYFVLLVAGLVAFVAGILRAETSHLLGLPLPNSSFFLLWLGFWFERSLGLLLLAPLLLVLATQPLKNLGYLVGEFRHDQLPVPLSRDDSIAFLPGLPVRSPRDNPLPEDPPSVGDWVEVLGIALAASLFFVLLLRPSAALRFSFWPLWGVELLFLVWASLRQGLRGATVVAVVSSAVPLLAEQFLIVSDNHYLLRVLLQTHIAGQVGAAFLLAVAASRVRMEETAHRHVVSRVPVVIYSVRFLRAPRSATTRASRGSKRAMSSEDPSHQTENGVGLAEVTLVSAASIRALRRRADELLGDYSKWLGCVHPEDRIILLAAIDQLTRQEQPVTCEYRLMPTDTESSRLRKLEITVDVGFQRYPSRWVRDTLAPDRNAQGKLVGWQGVVTDITEPRAIADDLRRTTTMFHTLVSNLPTGVFFIQGQKGLPILVNARARQLLGQREDGNAGVEHFSRTLRLFRADGTLYPTEELPVYQALKFGRTSMKDDIVVHRPDGQRIPLVTWAAPVSLSSGEEQDAAVWVLEDLSALHQSETARKDTEIRLRAVIETIAEALLVTDIRGRITSCNPSAASLFGLSADHLVGKSPLEIGWDFVAQDGSPFALEELPTEKAARTGRPVRNVIIGLQLKPKQQGELKLYGEQTTSPAFLRRWVMVNALPLGRVSADALSAGVVATFTDITAYVQAQETIRSSEERYRGLVESMPVMLCLHDSEMRITYTNPAVREITGYDFKELCDPAQWTTRISPSDLPRLLEAYSKAAKGESDRLEFRYRAKDNTEKVSVVLTEPRFQGEHIVGSTSLMIDITRQKQLERELERAARLELIGRLAGGLVHDFNGLLNVILNIADLARMNLPESDPLHPDMTRIISAAEQASGLVRQLLTFGQSQPMVVAEVDLNEVVRQTLNLLRASFPAKIQITTQFNEGELLVLGGRSQLQQVVLNLCLNAREAMEKGGRLFVQTRRQDNEILLQVSDTGEGMSEEIREKIFDPFFSTKSQGTGLGLAVVQQIVQQHHGKISVRSQLGQGATFEIRFPTAPQSSGAPPNG